MHPTIIEACREVGVHPSCWNSGSRKLGKELRWRVIEYLESQGYTLEQIRDSFPMRPGSGISEVISAERRQARRSKRCDERNRGRPDRVSRNDKRGMAAPSAESCRQTLAKSDPNAIPPGDRSVLRAWAHDDPGLVERLAALPVETLLKWVNREPMQKTEVAAVLGVQVHTIRAIEERALAKIRLQAEKEGITLDAPGGGVGHHLCGAANVGGVFWDESNNGRDL